VLVYNPNATQPGAHNAPRTPLCVAISEDGEHWQLLATLEDGPISEYSYPAVVEGRDGTIHITYTWRRERICHVELRLRKITMPLLLKWE
jgi:alpha-L-rhamnosidase